MGNTEEKTSNLSLDQLKRLLRIENDKTVKSFVKSLNVFVAPSAKDEILGTVLSKENISKFLGCRDLPEQFLIAREVAKLLSVSPATVISLCRGNFLPHYKFNCNRGSKVLFIREEILAKEVYDLKLDHSLDYYGLLWRSQRFQKIIDGLLLSAKERGKVFSGVSFDIVRSLVMQVKTVEQLSEQYEISPKEIRRIFERKIKAFDEEVADIYQQLQELQIKNKKLFQENSFLAYQSKKMHDNNQFSFGQKDESFDLFSVGIADLDFSARIKNCLLSRGINNLEELIKYNSGELMKIRSFGALSLVEVQTELKKRNLKLCD